jgi:stage III sporulation protein AH
MVLKKQTVWLLTMLSLVIVLSVYYITAPGQGPGQFATTGDSEEELSGEDLQNVESEVVNGIDVSIEEMTEEGTEASGISTDQLFTAIRMEIEEQRSELKENLQAITVSANASAEEKSEAMDKIQELHELAAKEDILEQLIVADEKYSDALVRANENEVRVIVKANDQLSNTDANDIMRLVRDETGIKQVAVEYQPSNN